MWHCVTVAMWHCGNVAMWLCGNVAIWHCGNMAIWQCGNVTLWHCGNVALCPNAVPLSQVSAADQFRNGVKYTNANADEFAVVIIYGVLETKHLCI